MRSLSPKLLNICWEYLTGKTDWHTFRLAEAAMFSQPDSENQCDDEALLIEIEGIVAEAIYFEDSSDEFFKRRLVEEMMYSPQTYNCVPVNLVTKIELKPGGGW